MVSPLVWPLISLRITRQVISACEAYIRTAITTEALIEIVPGPDFPTGGLIMGRQGIRRSL